MEQKAAAAYGKYRGIRDAAWQCLLDCGVKDLPVQASLVAAQLGVGLFAYGPNREILRQSRLEALLEAMGFAYADPSGRLMVFYNDETSLQQIRFTVAHELGHILLGHVGPSTPRGRLLEPSVQKLERAADSFAIRLLAPSCALWAKNACTAEEISALCDIPLDAAGKRARRMRELRERNVWLKSDLERELYHQLGLPDREEPDEPAL